MNEFELDEMRQQMAILKNKLEQQEIVNDRLLRTSMKKTVSKINRRYLALMILGLLMIPYSYWAFVMLCHFSFAFWIGTCVLMLLCVGATFYNGRDLRDPELMNGNLLDTRRKMARAKKFDNQWLIFGMPALILWLAWFVWEVYQQNGPEGVYPLLIGGGFGGVIGLIIGLSLHFKTQRQYQEIINQIEDVAGTDER